LGASLERQARGCSFASQFALDCCTQVIEEVPLLRTWLGGLLIAVATSASLLIGDVHGAMIVIVIIFGAVAAGLASGVGSLKKKLYLNYNGVI
jgi:hypothetical protein